ncbi:autophagy-related protein 22-like protein [Cunninghamella echinulata]|nr:autophagy-related protein 22-like protein [Cunninghamella echinulata]
MWSFKNKLLEDPFITSEDDNPTSSNETIHHNDKSLDLQPPATRKELWSYYFYYNGNNGYNIYSFLPSLLQYLAQKGGFDPTSPDRAPCSVDLSGDAPCNVPWLNTSIPVVSLMMYATAISFGSQFVLFTTFGSLADYGKFNKYILIISTLVSCTAQILPVIFINNDGSGWGGMVGLYIIALVSYGTSLVFYAAAFPTLSDNLPLVRKARNDPSVTVEETQVIVEKWRSTVSAISTTFSNIGFLVLSAIFSGVAFIPWSKGPFLNDEHTFGNTPLYYYIASAVCGGFWLINAIPYFLFQPSGRRGPPLPEGEHYLTIGWKSIFLALK